MTATSPTDRTTKSQTPSRASLGVLRGKVTLRLQTYPAQRLLRGRRAADGVPAILGLIGFAERLKLLWDGAKKADPYAHWWLYQVEQSLKQTRQRIQRTHDDLKQRLTQECPLEVSDPVSTHPQEVVLAFANPYAFLGAQMLAQFDRLIGTQLTFQHIGFSVIPAEAQRIKACERKIRATFLVPQRYHWLGIDINAVRQGSQQAQRAQALMGELPPEFRDGQCRALLAPRARAATAAPPTSASRPQPAQALPVGVVGEKDPLGDQTVGDIKGENNAGRCRD